MKQILFLLLITLSSCFQESNPINSFSQDENNIVKACENFNYTKLKNNLELYKNKSNEKIKFYWEIKLEREIIDEYQEQIILFWKEVQNENNKYISAITTYKIRLLKKNNEILFYKISETNNMFDTGENVKERFVFKNSTNKLQNFKDAYRETYKTELDFKQLFETKIVYGDKCRIVGMNTIFRTKLNKLVKEKDTETLIKWLKSPTTEIQLYAIDGILELKNKGREFDKKIDVLITIVENKKGSANICSGCNYWNRNITEIVTQIKNKHNNQYKQ